MTTINNTHIPIVIENAHSIIAELQTTLSNQHVCIFYHNDSDSPNTSVLTEYTLVNIDLEHAASASRNAYLLLNFRNSDNRVYQLDVDFHSQPSLPSTMTIQPDMITITDYRRNCPSIQTESRECGWTIITWIPETKILQSLT